MISFSSARLFLRLKSKARASGTLINMITGDIKQQVDRVWDAFWSGGISNPITVIEQFTHLL